MLSEEACREGICRLGLAMGVAAGMGVAAVPWSVMRLRSQQSCVSDQASTMQHVGHCQAIYTFLYCTVLRHPCLPWCYLYRKH